MSCDEIRELFSDHLDGALPREAEDRLGRHLEECARCRAALARYASAVAGLGGAAPEAPAGLGATLARRLESERLLGPGRLSGGRVRLAAAAAVLAAFAVGLLAGRFSVSPGDRAGDEDLTAMAWADGCSEDRVAVPSLDPRTWRTLPDVGGPDRVLEAGAYSIWLPARILSHGPYDPDVSAAVERAGSTCLPLGAPLGSRLALTVAPASTPETGEAGRFLVEIDPQRVLYARVLWHQEGLTWSLEGRAEATALLDVAREIARSTRIETTSKRSEIPHAL